MIAITPCGVEKIHRLKQRAPSKKTGIIATPEIFNTLTNSAYAASVRRFQYPVGFIETLDMRQTAAHQISNLSKHQDTLAFFFNLNPMLGAIAAYAWQAGKLVTVSSANRSGTGNCYVYAGLDHNFIAEADMCIAGDDLSIVEQRASFEAITSTIINLTTNSVQRDGVYATRIKAQALANHMIMNGPRGAASRSRQPRAIKNCLFLQAYNPNTYTRLPLLTNVDCIVFDLEDGCSIPNKPVARALLAAHAKTSVFDDVVVIVRLNGLADVHQLQADLGVAYTSAINGFALPMLQNAADVAQYEDLITALEKRLGLPTQTFCLFPIIETPAALTNAVEIAKASARNVALLLGHADLFAELGAERTTQNLHPVRLQYLSAARQANLIAFDTPYEAVKDLTALRQDALDAKRIGLDSKVALTFDQLNVINDVFQLPSAEQRRYESLLAQYTGGCQIIDGEFIAPPIAKRLRRLLAQSQPHMNLPKTTSSRGKTLSYGLAHDTVHVGQLVFGCTDVTVDAAWLMNWQSLVQTSNPIETSTHFCEQLGLAGRLIPYQLAVNLALCLLVESFSESSLFHLGVSNVVYEQPAYVGDTLRSLMCIDEIVPSSSKQYSILKTRVLLLNQHGVRVMSMQRNSLFPYLDETTRLPAVTGQPEHALFDAPISFALRERLIAQAAVWPARMLNRQPAVMQGDLFLHSVTRPLGLSNTVLFSTLYKNTHPVHINNARYGLDGLVVCGGFIIPLMHAAASRDICFALDTEIVDTMHINKVHHEDAIAAMSYVVAVEIVADGIECVTLRTFGLKNVDPERDLAGVDIPDELLKSPQIKPSDVNLICNTYCPQLSEKICARMTWKLWRKIAD